MRQIVLDTETTGLEPEAGHRVIEIGCVELHNRRPTGQTFHHYLRPDRAVDVGAADVHGLTDDFLADKPGFSEVVDDFLAFVKGAELVIHNAAFDIAFIDHELERAGTEYGCMAEYCTVLDTLALARRLHPGQRNTLDALCGRYHVDNSRRELHGALTDARILTAVYLAMTGGQVTLALDGDAQANAAADALQRIEREGIDLVVLRAGTAERAAHAERLEAIDRASGGRCVWKHRDALPASARAV